MCEIKLNLIDNQQVLSGMVRDSIAYAAVAALSAEPETIAELEVATSRFILGNDSPFASLTTRREIDIANWEGGLVIIDLPARIVVSELTHSHLGNAGELPLDDGARHSDPPIFYRVSEDWKFSWSLAEYPQLAKERRADRAANPPLDTRAVLYGRPLLAWISSNLRCCINATGYLDEGWKEVSTSKPVAYDANWSKEEATGEPFQKELEKDSNADDRLAETIAKEISSIHARWLLTPREDLGGRSPKEVLLAKREHIDFDLQMREVQWIRQHEGPPCLKMSSSAYRFAGFGTHECVVYYELVRHLLWRALTLPALHASDVEKNISHLEEIKNSWLEQPQPDFDGRTPAIIIENERKRLPIAVNACDMIIDEECPACQMLANEPLSPGFWHLDGCNMDDHFAFSFFATQEEWERDQCRWREITARYEFERMRSYNFEEGSFTPDVVEASFSVTDESSELPQ